MLGDRLPVGPDVEVGVEGFFHWTDDYIVRLDLRERIELSVIKKADTAFAVGVAVAVGPNVAGKTKVDGATGDSGRRVMIRRDQDDVAALGLCADGLSHGDGGWVPLGPGRKAGESQAKDIDRTGEQVKN